MRARGIVSAYLLPILIMALFGTWCEGFAVPKNYGGLMCRVEVRTHEGNQIEIIELKKRDDGRFDVIYTETYIEGKDKPAEKYVAKALKMINAAESDPKLIELNSSNHGQPGTYFITVKTSILTEKKLGAVGSSHTSNMLVFHYSKALQDYHLNHRLLNENMYKMPLNSCQIQ